MQTVLILDDDKVRHDEFRAHFEDQGAETIHSTTVGEAIAELKKHTDGVQKLDVVCLDHDLGTWGPTEYDATKTREYTGRDVSDWMRYHVDPSSIHLVRIHSWNIAAAASMERDLVAAGFTVVMRPFKLNAAGNFDRQAVP